MNTSTRVEFGLYDVTARSDSTPTTEQAKAFCNLSKDLLLESVPSQNKYGTLETRQWLMDGSFLFFPRSTPPVFLGLLERGAVERKRHFCHPASAEYPLRQESQQQRPDAAFLLSDR